MSSSPPLLAVASLIAGLLSVPPPGHTAVAEAGTGADVVEHVAARSATEQRRVLDYWTPRRMAAAVPLGVAGTLDRMTGLPPVFGMAARPLAPPRRQHRATRPSTTTSGTRWTWRGAVTRTTGRVFLTLAGVDFVCSASTVRSASRDVVVTAGHCVKDGAGAWADNWTFVPGYRDGRKPYGSYTARRMFVAEPWARGGGDDHDLGMVALNTSDGKHVADAVGTQEIAFGGRRGGRTHGFGFPADPPYDGRELVYCAGRLRQDPHGQSGDQGLTCDMTAGSSGGPWFTGFDAETGTGTITSVSSFKYTDDRRTMYGPYFGESAEQLYAIAQKA
ncbi:trypsin-like serine peptidase [Streptosporangium soli]|nr:hypothetical protein [Streptosporangium sp. KLBMP 9127]